MNNDVNVGYGFLWVFLLFATMVSLLSIPVTIISVLYFSE